MDLSEQVIHDVIHPTAAFCDYKEQAAPPVRTSEKEGQGGVIWNYDTSDDETSEDEHSRDEDWRDKAKRKNTERKEPTRKLSPEETLWAKSLLNPRNRIDSLEIPRNPLWEIDGCTSFGNQFYVTPRFVDSPRPLRVDLIVMGESSEMSARKRELLDLDAFFHTRDKDRIAKLGLTRHVLRILHDWASSYQDPSKIYDTITFGSRFSIKRFSKHLHKVVLETDSGEELERNLMSPARLASYWGNDIELPVLVDVNKVVYLSQIHDSVCLVKVEDRVWIFKTLTSATRFLYHELRHLLRIKSHPNVISRPAHLITKSSTYGGETVVLGFTTEYQAHGSLRDLIPFLKLHQKVTLADMTKWGVQLASALVHLRQTTNTFYPDLRLDNIVLSASNDVVMVDFEQRGVWCEFGAPETNAIDYVQLLAVDGEIAPEVKDKYAAILSGLLPNWKDTVCDQPYSWPENGYNISWACLTPAEQECCEVYMLGRVLWCIFEAKSAPQRAAAWLSYRWEPIVEFPDYTITPEPMRDLIDRCTRGRRPGLSKYIVRERNQLVLRDLENTGKSTARQVQETAKEWWTREIDASVKWLEERDKGMKAGTWKENYYDRPSLKQVHAELEAYYRQVGGGSA